ncbi:MAG: hypothetical protein ABSG17_21685 [Spirochaetia bacterium]|jgi:hypothetical protein
MRWYTILVLVLAATGLSAQPDRKLELANRIADDIFSLWSEADIPSKYSILIWPAYKELSKESNWPRLEFIRDISTVGDLYQVWPSREAIVQAVYENLPSSVLKEFVDLTDEQAKAAAGGARQDPSEHTYVLPLVEQFKNQVRGIIQTNTIPAPAAIALAASDKYKNDQATQDFAANSLKEFLENPGTAGTAATKAVPPQGTGIAPVTTPTLQAAMQSLAGAREPQNVGSQIRASRNSDDFDLVLRLLIKGYLLPDIYRDHR